MQLHMDAKTVFVDKSFTTKGARFWLDTHFRMENSIQIKIHSLYEMFLALMLDVN
jgi:hypothetical protein